MTFYLWLLFHVFQLKWEKCLPFAPFAVSINPNWNTGVSHGLGTKLLESPTTDRTNLGCLSVDLGFGVSMVCLSGDLGFGVSMVSLSVSIQSSLQSQCVLRLLLLVPLVDIFSVNILIVPSMKRTMHNHNCNEKKLLTHRLKLFQSFKIHFETEFKNPRRECTVTFIPVILSYYHWNIMSSRFRWVKYVANKLT